MKNFKELREKVKKPTGGLKDACWTGYTAVGMKMKGGRKVPNCVPEEVSEAKDHEYSDPHMAVNQLRTIMHNAEEMCEMLGNSTDLPEWVESKITLAEDYIMTVANYMRSELKEEVVAEGSGKNVVKSVKVGNFRHDLVNTGMGWQVRIHNGDKLYDTGLSKNSEEKGLAALDNSVAYTKKQLNIKEQGVAEGSISDLLNKDSASPKFNDHPAPLKTKHSGSIPTPYEKGRLDAHRKKPYNNIHKDKQDAEDYKTGYGHVKSKQGVAEGKK